MKQTNRVILVDIDDTIENLCQCWCDFLNEQYGTTVLYSDVDDWDISKFFPELSKEQVYSPLHDERLWYCLSPLEGAVKYLQALIQEGFQVYLCTTTDYRNVRPKYEGVIQRYFPFISWSQVIVTSKKQMIKANFLVDDGVHNLADGDYHKILMTAPHNRHYDAASNGMVRVNSWKEAYNAIHRICESEDTLSPAHKGGA